MSDCEEICRQDSILHIPQGMNDFFHLPALYQVGSLVNFFEVLRQFVHGGLLPPLIFVASELHFCVSSVSKAWWNMIAFPSPGFSKSAILLCKSTRQRRSCHYVKPLLKPLVEILLWRVLDFLLGRPFYELCRLTVHVLSLCQSFGQKRSLKETTSLEKGVMPGEECFGG